MRIMLQGKTDENRLSVTTAACKAVDNAGGYIFDVKQFSNLAICYMIELPADGFARLREALIGLNIMMDPPSELELQLGSGSSEAEVMGSLRITFLHDEPDLRIEIPAVPG
jgi:hypothetical protein